LKLGSILEGEGQKGLLIRLVRDNEVIVERLGGLNDFRGVFGEEHHELGCQITKDHKEKR
jgi:hypothetical protein